MSDRDELLRIMDPSSSPAAGGAKSSQAERIYWELRSSIVLAELRPGTVMVEGALAETFGASKTPVREALRQLRHDGVVTVLPRKGYVVSALGLDDLLDVYALRGLLQPSLAAAAASKCGQHHLDELEAVAKRDRDARTYLQSLMAGAEFQIIVAQASGNKRAARVVRDLIFEAFRFWMLLQPPAGRLQEALAFQQERYRETYAALESGDARGASRIMAELIEASRQEMTARMLASATLG